MSRQWVLWLFPLLFSCFPLSSAVYQWPSAPYEVLERILYEGSDLAGNTIGALAMNCERRLGSSDPLVTTVAAQWLRLAYHDMSTHNVTAGTGGLDASIYYELSRAENIGEGMTLTMIDFSLSSNKYLSRADIIAMGAVLAVASCGGPVLPIRGGRIDTFTAGRPGVPEPQQDLESHIENFRLQGFNATEMISLVACGHTIGGVRNLDFPEIVPLSNEDPSGFEVATFDSTSQFDATVVSQYLNGTTQNPLVVGSNETTRSDLRIFSHDNNATMISMNAEEAFRSTCTTVLTKMIDTVPVGVQLGEEIKPIPFKITPRFTIFNGTSVFDVTIRVMEPTLSAAKPSQRIIRLLWCDQRGLNADCKDGTVNAAGPAVLFVDGSNLVNLFSPISQQMNIGFSTYQITVPTTFMRSVGKFWFEVDNLGNGTKVIQQDSGGGGAGYQMPAQAGEIMHVPSTFRVFESDGTFFHNEGPNETPKDYIITAAIRTDSANNATVLAKFFDSTFFNTTGPTTPFNTTLTLSRNASAPPVDGYTFYSTTLKQHIGGLATADFELQLQSNASASTGPASTIVLDFVLIQPADKFSALAPFANILTTTAPLPSPTSSPNPVSSSRGEHTRPQVTYILMVILGCAVSYYY